VPSDCLAAHLKRRLPSAINLDDRARLCDKQPGLSK
jgi:hypothetical protein